MSEAAFETPESGARVEAGEACGPCAWLAALSSPGCLDSLILSTQPREAFLSHTGDIIIRAPPESGMPGLFGNFVFSCPGVVCREKWGMGQKMSVRHGCHAYSALLQPWLPRFPQETLPSLCPVPMKLCPAPLGWPSSSSPPCLSEETGPLKSHPTPSPS